MSSERGIIKVELKCSKTGRKLFETSNFISKGVRKYAYEAAMRNLYTNYKASGGNAIQINDPFRNLVLTDNANPEEPNTDYAPQGNVVGWANTNQSYSGSNTLRGSYNTNESFTNPEQVHIVVDFATSASNGTFNSIYFVPQNNILFNPLNDYFKSDLTEGFKSRIISFQRYGNYYYGLIGTNNIYGTAIRILNDDYELVEDIALQHNTFDFHIKDGILYYVIESSINQVWKFPLGNPSQLSQINISAPAGMRFGGIVFDEGNDVWILSSSSVSSSSASSSSIYDDTFSLVEVSELYTGPGYFRFKLFYNDGVVISSENGIMNDDFTFRGLFSPSATIVGCLDDRFLCWDGSIATNRMIPKWLISSRALLDEPVTKRNNQTMKITYDFMLPPMY